MILRLEDGVNLDLDIVMRPAMKAVDRAWSKIDIHPTATSIRDGEHSCKSLHPYGRAIDLRTSNLKPHLRHQIVADLKAELGPLGFDVVFEQSDISQHLHIEYDPKEPT